MLIKHLHSNEFDLDIYLSYGTKEEIIKLAKKLNMYQSLEQQDEDFFDSDGFMVPRGRSSICYVSNHSRDIQNCLFHEITHGVHHLLDYIGINMTFITSNEIVAHYMAYYMEQGILFLNEIKKYNARKSKQSKRNKNLQK